MTPLAQEEKDWQINRFYYKCHDSFLKLMEQQEFLEVFSFLANVLTRQKILEGIKSSSFFLFHHCKAKSLNPDWYRKGKNGI
jgi:hypothetical protein